ncbi:hypothetical protein GPL15_23945 [Clostridium sp. MCC353]|uniref:hypothetical protein n=1 Tax=Clostridium sp. MCC353 TaxID=2592646 RepID=UPI001C0143B6|nr:hypothetical protein [Clostridium sp. MCC353]MBT9779535.1 hypothetical protein [Clostridium sp. MCC353]
MAAANMPAKKQDSQAVYLMKLLVGLFFMFGFGYVIPPFATVTRLGVQVIGIFIGVIWFLSWFEMTWPPLLAIPALVFTGYIKTADFITSMLGNTTVFQMILLMALCFAIRQSGAGKVIAGWFITRKCLKGHPVLFCCVFLWAFFIASIFLSYASFFLAWEVLDNVFKVTGYQKREKLPILMIIGTFMAAWLGYCSLPIAGLQLAMVASFNSTMAVYGIELDTATYIICGLIVGSAVAVAEGLSIRYIFRADMSRLADLDPDEMGIDTSTLHFNKQQLILLFAFLIGIGFSIVSSFVPKESALGVWMGTITLYGWFALILTFLAWIKLDGKPVFNIGESLSKGVMWGAVLCTGAFVVIGGAITSDACGIKAGINALLNPLFGQMHWFIFMLFAVALTSIITNLMSNLSTGVVIITIIAPFVVNYMDAGINPSVLGCAITISAMLGMLTMSAGAWSPMLIGNEWIDSQPLVLKYGAGMVAIYIAVATVLFGVLGYVL